MIAEDRYDSLICWYFYETARKYGPDPHADWRIVKAQVRAESSFNPMAISEDGAIGLMQLMVRTAHELGIDDPTNPEENIRGGINYLWKLWAIFKKEGGIERWKFALGAFNAGIANIIEAQQRAESRGLDPSRWVSIVNVLEGVTGADDAPKTINYVARIVHEFETLKEEEKT